MKTSAFTTICGALFLGVASASEVRLFDDEYVDMTLKHWTADGKLHFNARLERKAEAYSGERATYAQYMFITLGMDPETLRELFEDNEDKIPTAIGFMDGFTFVYNKLTDT